MSGSEGRRTHGWLLAGLMLACAAMPVAAQQNTREQEQIRRLRQQLQQLQQQQAEQQQALQRTEAEKAQALSRLAAADADLKRAQAAAAARLRLVTQAEQDLQSLREQHGRLGSELDVAKAEAQAGARSLQQQRNDQAALQRQLAQREAALADLQARHATQSQGLQACVSSNRALYSLGQDLLQRYADKGLREVLAQNESFLQFQRVALENLMQGYQDKLDLHALKGDPGREGGRAP